MVISSRRHTAATRQPHCESRSSHPRIRLTPMSYLNDHDDSRSLTPARKLKDIFEELQDINLEDQIVDQEREQLGLGFSCDVFRAWSTAHNKIVAVKRIRFFLLEDISFASVRLVRHFPLCCCLRYRLVFHCRILEGKCVYGPNSTIQTCFPFWDTFSKVQSRSQISCLNG